MQFPQQYSIQKFGDDRDYIITKLNHLQAQCGTGSYLVCSQLGQPWQKVSVEEENEYIDFPWILSQRLLSCLLDTFLNSERE